MVNKNGNLRKTVGGILGAVTLLVTPAGLVSCGFGGGEPAGETEERNQPGNVDNDDDNDRSNNENREDDDDND